MTKRFDYFHPKLSLALLGLEQAEDEANAYMLRKPEPRSMLDIGFLNLVQDVLCHAPASIDPALQAKKPAAKQGPELYLEPKWLR